MKITLKKVIEISKNFDKEKGCKTSISVYITSTAIKNERITLVIDPFGDGMTDRLAMIGFEDCFVSWYYRYAISDEYNILIVIVDLDRHF